MKWEVEKQGGGTNWRGGRVDNTEGNEGGMRESTKTPRLFDTFTSY